MANVTGTTFNVELRHILIGILIKYDGTMSQRQKRSVPDSSSSTSLKGA